MVCHFIWGQRGIYRKATMGALLRIEKKTENKSETEKESRSSGRAGSGGRL